MTNPTHQICTREDFIRFLQDLATQYRTDPASWENQDLESFLEAMAAYARDIDGFYKNLKLEENPDEPSWRVFSDILLGATIYE